MAKGLDVGTMNIISAEQGENGTELTRERNAFVEIDHSDVADQILADSDIPHTKKEDCVRIVGEESFRFANIFNTTVERPMSRGTLSADMQASVSMLTTMIDKVIGPPDYPDETVYFTSPAEPVDSDMNLLHHQRAIESHLEQLGYQAEFIHEGMAAIYTELEEEEFSGLGISFGAGMTNLCLSYYAVPVTQFSIARGGDWIDKQAAKVMDKSIDKVTSIKEEQLSLSAQQEIDGTLGALSVYYDSLVEYLVEMIEKEIDEEDIDQDLDIPVIVTGGTSSPDGFEDLLKEHIKQAEIPLSISEIRHVEDPLYTVAQGALIAAQSHDKNSTENARLEQRVGESSPEENTDWTFDF